MANNENSVFAEDSDYIYNNVEELRQSQRLLAGLVGAVALILPLVLIAFDLSHETGRETISAYYYESLALGDFFVAGLFVVGGLMLTYRGNSQRASKLASAGGLLAMGVGAFPTDGWSRCTTIFVGQVSETCSAATGSPHVGKWFAQPAHVICAITLFIVLALYCRFVFLKPRTRNLKGDWAAQNTDDPSKKRRNVIYWICFGALIGSMALIALKYLDEAFELGLPIVAHPNVVFYGESIGLIAFGVAWLTHSRFFFVLPFLRDKDDPVYTLPGMGG